MALYVDYEVDLGSGKKFILSLSKSRALPIINELNRRLPMNTYVFRRGSNVYIYLGIRKGGISQVECSFGKVLYDVVQDCLMICLSEKKITSRKFIEVGSVKEGIEVIMGIDDRVDVTIRKLS